MILRMKHVSYTFYNGSSLRFVYMKSYAEKGVRIGQVNHQGPMNYDTYNLFLVLSKCVILLLIISIV